MKKLIHENSRFMVLFIISILSILMPGLIVEAHLSDMVFNIMFSIMVIASTFSIAHNKKHQNKIKIIGSLTLIMAWVLILDILPFYHPKKLGALPLFFFFVYTVYRLVYTILKAAEVTPDVIFGAITGYIFLGYAGAFYFEIIQEIYPHSFNLPEMSSPMSLEYFSFVTMTTLGYGDIIPNGNAARSGTIVLTILGQFYIAVIVAILVSKYLLRVNNK